MLIKIHSIIFQIYKQYFKLRDTVNKYEYLDGLRGLFAIVVVLHHFKLYNSEKINCELVDILSGMSLIVAVVGFFVLSSFLLTYRLLVEFEDETKNSFRDKILIIIKYFLRRIFRIYIPFVIFSTMIKYGPEKLLNYQPKSYVYSSWYKLVTLGDVGYNHLWTIAPEIKFYFIIPIISLTAHKLGNYRMLFVLIALLFLVSRDIYLSLNDTNKQNANSGTLKIFAYGSISAITFYSLDINKKIKEYLEKRFVKEIIASFSFYLTYLGIKISVYFRPGFMNEFKHGYLTIPAFIWGFIIFLMAIGHPNYFTHIFSGSLFLKQTGKFSFGIYLLHIYVINIDQVIPLQTRTEVAIMVVVYSFILGYSFHLILENPLMNLVNKICEQLSNLNFFKKQTHNDNLAAT